LWGAFCRRTERFVFYHACLQEPPDDPADTLVGDPLAQTTHETVMVNPVEKRLQVQIYHPVISLLDVDLSGRHGLMGASVRAEPVTVFAEGRIEYRLQDL